MMAKILYKSIDGRGRITLPPKCREILDIKGGDIIRIETDDEYPVLYISKLDVVDLQAEESEFVAECLAASVKCLNNEQKVSLAAYLLSKASDIDVFEGDEGIAKKNSASKLVTIDKEVGKESDKKKDRKAGNKK